MGRYKDLSELELFDKVRKYDSWALEELYDRYSPLIYTMIRKIAHDEKAADNIFIEVFSIIWLKSSHFDPASENVYTWLITLARNRAIDSLKRSRSSKGALDFYDEDYESYFIIPELAKDIDSLDIETAMKVKPKIENALSKLTDAQKYVIHLAYYEGYTLNEISQKLNIPVETVRNKVMTALYNLKENLVQDSVG